HRSPVTRIQAGVLQHEHLKEKTFASCCHLCRCACCAFNAWSLFLDEVHEGACKDHPSANSDEGHLPPVSTISCPTKHFVGVGCELSYSSESRDRHRSRLATKAYRASASTGWVEDILRAWLLTRLEDEACHI